MKYSQVDEAITKSEDQLEWKQIILKPLLLGVAFGTGCYVAKIILNSPIMGSIMEMAEKGARIKK